MSQPVPALHARPLFMDALSGEFRHPDDTQDRTHTISRLLVATYVKGEVDSRPSADIQLDIYKYNPSWASHILAEVMGITTDETFNAFGIVLTDTKTPRSLQLKDEIVGGNRETLAINELLGLSARFRRMDLALVDPVVEDRQAVQVAVANLFNR